MLKSFQYRLYPSSPQRRLLEQTLETCRHFYNACLDERKTAWEERKESVGKFAQMRQVKTLKATNPYASGVHSHVLQVVVADLDKAFEAFFRRVKAGETPGYPRFKGRNRFHSFGFKEHGNGFRVDGRRLRLSGIGRVAVRWHTPIEGQVKTVRIACKAGKWYASFACEVPENPLPSTGRAVGIDVGISNLIATSEGEIVAPQNWYRQEQDKLRIIQRRVARRKRGGSNRRKAVAELQRQHARIQNRRRDFLNKLACGLVANYDFIALENLQITNMVNNHHLSKSILDAGWGYFIRHLAYKAEEAGRKVVLVNPAYTSMTCSGCGVIFDGLSLADRWIDCVCGVSLDRDVNAAINILNRAGQARWEPTWAVAPCVSQEAVGL
jgi:putative transposase